MGAQAAWGRVIGEGSAMAHWRALVTCAYQRGGRTAGRRIASKVPRVGRDVLCVPPPFPSLFLGRCQILSGSFQYGHTVIMC